MSRKPQVRHPGGVSRSLDYVNSCLSKRCRGRSTPKAMALLEVATLLHVVAKQAQRGDKECGYFLAELLALFWKTRISLSKANNTFRDYFLRLESAHFPTTKDSQLRRIISRIIARAQIERHRSAILKLIPNADLVIKIDNKLLELPELNSSTEAVNAWTNVVVYPQLKSMARKLGRDPIIGNMKKALDENGKFQISRLKPLIRATVARIASLPRRYYFDIL
jgi:hypothetical protein